MYADYFTQVPPGLDSELLGAFHSAEIPCVFGNLLPPRPWREADGALSDAMMSYWINFATCGDPHGEGLPVWPAYDSAQDTAMTLGGTIATRSGVNRRGVDFFGIYWDKVRSGELPMPQ